MANAPDQRLLEPLLDSWDRNNTILLNLLRALPEAGLEVRAMELSHHDEKAATFLARELRSAGSSEPQNNEMQA